MHCILFLKYKYFLFPQGWYTLGLIVAELIQDCRAAAPIHCCNDSELLRSSSDSCSLSPTQMGFTDTMLRDSSWCGRVCGQEHQFIMSDPAVNMWTTEKTLELTEDLHSTLYVCGTHHHLHIKTEIKKVMSLLHWLWNTALLSRSWTRNSTLWSPYFDGNTKS
jgi:hypothetical protein